MPALVSRHGHRQAMPEVTAYRAFFFVEERVFASLQKAGNIASRYDKCDSFRAEESQKQLKAAFLSLPII
ncbi:MAG: hypothetical protein BMS9Abin33_1299 [Gammaproteobacteria bacterium]|nr:MAG: hypothetical protein BMS9Abin33_1299 [Gammaproteobacteria bacterium]